MITTTILKPPVFFKGRSTGLHQKLPELEYHESPAISAGFLHKIETRSVLHAWDDSPFNPEWEMKRERKFDLGTAVHLACLEPERLDEKVVIVQADNFTTKEARNKRDAAYEQFKVPILAHEFGLIATIREKILEHPLAKKYLVLQRGSSEVTGYWFDPRTNLPCKLRVDFVCNAGRDLVDIKTASDGSEAFFLSNIKRMGHHMRAAWYMDGWEILTEGKRPKHYWFLVVERQRPFGINLIELSPRAIEWGTILNRKALDQFAVAYEKDICPGYVDPISGEYDPRTVDLPTYLEMDYARRMAAEHFDLKTPGPNVSELRLAYEMYRPLDQGSADDLPEDERL